MLDRRELLIELGLAGAAAYGMAARRRPARPPPRAPDGPLALVTADEEAHVAVVSLAAMRVVARVATIPDPRSIQGAARGRAVVAHAAEGAISILSGRPLRVRRVLRGFGAPRYTAVAPGGQIAYVSDSDHGEIAVVDLVAARVLRRVEVGAGARHLSLHPDGQRLWVTLGSSAGEIAVVDVGEPERPRALRRVAPPFLAHDVAFAPSGRRVWVTAGREQRIAILAADGGTTLRTLRADAAPQHVAFGAGVAYVASGDDGIVRVHGLRDGRMRRRTKVAAGSYNVESAGGRAVLPSLSSGALTVLDASGALTGRVAVARAAHDACVLTGAAAL